MNQYKKIFPCIFSVLIAEGVGLLSGYITANSADVYSLLIKPSWSPPSWLFGVVWPILYFLMGIAACIVYQSNTKKSQINNALKYYSFQLAFNFIWSIVFFTLNMKELALIILILLIILVIITIIKFYRIDKTAGYLMVPYLIWIIFATFLNYYLIILNK